MSYYNYIESKVISEHDYCFYALIMAAMRKADSNNIELLKTTFPQTWDELYKRYHSPDGMIEADKTAGCVHYLAQGDTVCSVASRVHYLAQGITVCGIIPLTVGWQPDDKWVSYDEWESVTCEQCLKHKRRGPKQNG